jgi:hypothetical protein
MPILLSRIPLRARTGGLVAVGLALLVTSGQTFRAAPQGQTRAFLITRSDLGIHYGKFEEDCPQGFEMTVEEAFLASKTPAERERLLLPENAKEYGKGWKDDFITGPGGENVCNNPKSFLNDPRHPPYRGVRGTVAYGMNLDGTLDGRPTPMTCGHEQFVGENGEPGIDNQLYRAVGCSKNVRGLGPPPSPVRIDPFLVEIRGLDDSRNDDHVEVGIFSTDDTPLQGPDGKLMANQTLTMTKNARWRTTVAGRIVDGQLTTEVIEALYLRQVLSTWGLFGQNYDFEFHGARLRMSLQQDGTLTGLLAAYRPIENIFTVGRCCKGTASTANTDCASEHKTLALMADGYPDPATGQCTMISSATNISGIPVFIAPARSGLSSTK